MSEPSLEPIVWRPHYGPHVLESIPTDGGRVPGYARIEVRPLSPTIGAEVSGVDLGKLDDESFDEVRRAFLQCRVLFFRDQHIQASDQIDFARRFGPLEHHPFLPQGKEDEIVRFEKDDATKGVENMWHSDVSWREVPSLGSVLRAIEVPAVGGDTLFCDMVQAYKGLPDDVRARIDGARAVHDFTHSFGHLMSPDELAKRQAEFPAVEHPVVRTHPDTGEKILYVNRIFTSHIVGMDRDESDRLLDVLYRQADVPEYQCRFHWEAGSVAFWDNRAVQHYAASDYYPSRRVMERVTIIGDRPF